MAKEREVPTGVLSRFGGLARVAARTGVSLMGRGDGSAAAEKALEVLGNLRGLAAKVGQMASYVDGFVPYAQSEAFTRVLSQLQSATPPSPFSSVQRVVESELKMALAQAFVSFEPTPIASASIGQVHRARLADGRDVAVKVQHPGIAEAMEADLGGAGSIAAMANLLSPRGVNAKDMFDELAQRFREELDYRREATQQQTFALLHADDERVHVPAVVPSHSAARVMTSELVRAHGFEHAVQRDPAQRKADAELLWHFVFKSIVQGGMFNADPHPGNYLFHDDGRISFLDFGCVQQVNATYFQVVPELHAAALADDYERFFRVGRVACETREGDYERALLSYLWRCYEPLRSPRYHITRTYVAALVRDTQSLKAHMLKRSANVTPVPRGLVLLNRLQFGFWSILARFDVPADYARVHQAILNGRAAVVASASAHLGAAPAQ
jgi:predicted unusual protein kinase regulating ubiquinone biosynthesis (AarF/ABC1/UbiB family)